MNPEQIDAYLAQPRHAVACVLRSDGAPQSSPVWILYRDGKIYFSILESSAKFRQLERDPRISLCIDAGHPDARAVMIRGTAELVREASAWSEELTWQITRRYHETDDAARAFDAEMKSEGPSALVVVTPERIIGRDFN